MPKGAKHAGTLPQGHAMTSTCPRCGAALHPLADLVKLAQQTSDRAREGLHALENRRIAVPSLVPVALQEAHLDGRILAARLACHAGVCERSESKVRAKPPVPASAPAPAPSLHPTSKQAAQGHDLCAERTAK